MEQNQYVITAVQVSKGKIKISYDAAGDMGTDSYTLISAEKARPEFYELLMENELRKNFFSDGNRTI